MSRAEVERTKHGSAYLVRANAFAPDAAMLR
jgi:hypothetical protein